MYDVYQALDGASALPSLPHENSVVVTGSAVNTSAAASVDNVSDVSKQKMPPAVAAKPKQPSRHVDASKSSFTLLMLYEMLHGYCYCLFVCLFVCLFQSQSQSQSQFIWQQQ